jgi:uncharacterized protein YjbI with pentapeptide repeats
VVKPSTHPPRIDKLILSGLADSDGEGLRDDDERDRERYVSLDVSGQMLRGVKFAECEFEDLTADDADLRAARFVETRLTRVNAPILRAPNSEWRDVVLENSRIGSAELYDSIWRSTVISSSKLGYLNFRSARLVDVRFVDCNIEDLDLSGANALRVSFEGCTIHQLDVGRSTFEHVDLRGADIRGIRGVEDLRGATISDQQLTEFAPTLAAHLGIRVE